MLSTHSQIVKWSLPAFALIIGLFWYKRRRVDRADPGGISTSNVLETVDKLKANPSRENVNLSDSGTNANDSYSSLHAQSIKEAISNCKQVSEQQVGISTMMPATLPIFIPLANSLENNQSWYEEVENISNKEILLENNPNTNANGFHMITGSMDATNYYNDITNNGEMMKNIFVNNHDIKQNNVQLVSSSVDKQNEINHTSDFNEQGEQLQNYPPEEESKIQTQALSERDSANYSPVSGVLEGSVTDEARSEGSTDSGKGGSIEGQIKDTPTIYLYEFSIHNDLVGKLIGRQGSFLQNIRTKAGVYIIVKRHPMSMNDKICVIQGSNEGISIALDIIRRKFPEKKYPDLTLEQIIPVAMIGEIIPIIPVIRQLSLIEGINNDASVCYVIKPNRFFVHIPTHPTHPMLRILDTNMTEVYSSTIPPIPDEITKGMVLAAPIDGKWARVCVEDPDPHGETTLVRLVDHGGYRTYSNCSLKKIRSDFLFLPFQAIEVFLANIRPKYGEWHPDALNVVEQIVTGRLGQAQIAAFVNSQLHINLLFNIPGHGMISLADELIARDYAEPLSWGCLVSNGYTEVTS